MSQAALVGRSNGHRPTVTTGGKRAMRSVIYGISNGGEENRNDQDEDHAGPVAEAINGGERMPPQYEQVFTEPTQRGSSSVTDQRQVWV
jgi:hypothetical protein